MAARFTITIEAGKPPRYEAGCPGVYAAEASAALTHVLADLTTRLAREPMLMIAFAPPVPPPVAAPAEPSPPVADPAPKDL